jgi:hypothetical protein
MLEFSLQAVNDGYHVAAKGNMNVEVDVASDLVVEP